MKPPVVGAIKMLKSLESNIRAFVRFSNHSERTVMVQWASFSGDIVNYTNLPPGANCVVSSCHCQRRDQLNVSLFLSQDQHLLHPPVDIPVLSHRRATPSQQQRCLHAGGLVQVHQQSG